MANDNPALRLHRILTDWQKTPNGKAVPKAADGGSGWVATQLEVMDLLSQVRAHLESVAVANDGDPEVTKAARDRLMEDLVKGIFLGDPAKAQGSGELPHLSDAILDQLLTIGLTWASPDPDPTPEAVTTILDAAVEAQKAVIVAPGLDEESRHYLLELASHLAKAAGDVSVFGTSHLRSLAAEFSGGLGAHFNDGDRDDQSRLAAKSRWRREALIHDPTRLSEEGDGSHGDAATSSRYVPS